MQRWERALLERCKATQAHGFCKWLLQAHRGGCGCTWWDWQSGVLHPVGGIDPTTFLPALVPCPFPVGGKAGPTGLPQSSPIALPKAMGTAKSSWQREPYPSVIPSPLQGGSRQVSPSPRRRPGPNLQPGPTFSTAGIFAPGEFPSSLPPHSVSLFRSIAGLLGNIGLAHFLES